MAAQQSTTPITDEANASTCCHHWTIQPATGPVSQGVCKLCGEVREFKNYVEAATWGDSRLSNKSNTEDSQTLVKPKAAKEESADDEEDE